MLDGKNREKKKTKNERAKKVKKWERGGKEKGIKSVPQSRNWVELIGLLCLSIRARHVQTFSYWLTPSFSSLTRITKQKQICCIHYHYKLMHLHFHHHIISYHHIIQRALFIYLFFLYFSFSFLFVGIYIYVCIDVETSKWEVCRSDPYLRFLILFFFAFLIFIYEFS